MTAETAHSSAPRGRTKLVGSLLAISMLFNAVAIGVLLSRGGDPTEPRAAAPTATATATATVTATVTATPTPSASVLGREFGPSDRQSERPVVRAPDPQPPSEPDPVPPTTATCRNSHDPDCGPVFWRPKPATNDPLTMDAGFSPNAPEVGETVTFTVDAADPDARVICCDVAIDGRRLANTHGCANPRYGRWDTPPQQPGAKTFTFEHTFDEPGVHTVRFFAVTGSRCAHPYKHTGSITLEFVVFDR